MSDEDRIFRLTPKGYVSAFFLSNGLGTVEQADALWNGLQAHCMRRLRQDDPDGEFAALVFDGVGGTVIGVSANPCAADSA